MAFRTFTTGRHYGARAIGLVVVCPASKSEAWTICPSKRGRYGVPSHASAVEVYQPACKAGVIEAKGVRYPPGALWAGGPGSLIPGIRPLTQVPLAQLDRAGPSYGQGSGFKSQGAHLIRCVDSAYFGKRPTSNLGLSGSSPETHLAESVGSRITILLVYRSRQRAARRCVSSPRSSRDVELRPGCVAETRCWGPALPR